ncbi:PIG-L deacetylase family protein [Rubinisphaera margarita]|uniref:PIG-L deacetylase family protein n=1 Tax=Rubinisphaera margarita TaxID=2909586 RepID=UPI001EE8E453|nr:PIG-L deacetylase family protein [Rubinisphaera margarita]MCG6155284.1 PIG-L family deacetylase [Rubinisphaera margarita]
MNPFTTASCRTVLCVGAHADDIEIGCGGTLLHLTDSFTDCQVIWVVLSSNDVRHQEAQESAGKWLERVERTSVRIESFRDSYFPAQWAELKDYMHGLAREFQPDLIFTHSSADRHQDHRVVSELTHCAFRNHVICEYEIPKYDGDLKTPNCYVPLTTSIADRKIELLMESFPSQHEKDWYDAETFRALLRIRGMECHSKSRMAEGFHVRKFSLFT